MSINGKTVPYIIKNSNGQFTLKTDHPYYYQVQGQLYVTNREFCDFIIYTFKDFCRISVKRDDVFIPEILEKLDIFYEQYFKPAIIEKYLYRNYGTVFCSQ